jgi:hypothetical protein
MKPTSLKSSQQPVVGSSPKEITSKHKAQIQNNRRLDAYMNKRLALELDPKKTFPLELAS